MELYYHTENKIMMAMRTSRNLKHVVNIRAYKYSVNILGKYKIISLQAMI